MRIARAGLVAVLVTGLASPALAGDLRDSVAKAAQQQPPPPTAPRSSSSGRSKTMMWTGGLLFAGGMAVGLFGFMDNQNGEFTEFGDKGEADATHKVMGTVGISAAFAGGLLMYAGARRAERLPTVVVSRDRVRLVKRFAW